MVKRRAIVIIDGSNFYFKLKGLKLHNLISFDFSGFINRAFKKYKIIFSCYYIGKVRTDGTEKTQIIFNSQRKLLAHLRLNNVRYSLGYLLKSGGKFHEKGVDVNMAVDILKSVYKNLCDHIILISSDTDLLPVIKEVKENGKTIEYVGFSHQPSLAMIANCSVSRLLTKEDLEPFTKKV